MSYKVGVKTAGDKDWVTNALRFATIDEAKHYSVDLDWRWTVKKELKVLPSDDPVNAAWKDGHLVRIKDEPDESASAAHG